jgi:rod shape-determining protein MreC
VPRNRSVRLATLGATAQRTTSPSYGFHSGGSLGRRAVVVALVVLSLGLITGYFRESDTGRLHDLQGTAAQVLEPFQIGAERVVRPFRDAWGWFDSLRTAKADKERLEARVRALQNELVNGPPAATPASDLRGVAQARAPRFPGDFRPLEADVITDLPRYQQQVVVSAGRSDGVRRYDPVVTTHGFLLGHVSKVGPGTSLVTLISDRTSSVSVYDLEHPAKGVLQGRGPGVGTLLLDRVPKQTVAVVGDNVITAGRLSGEDYASFYPSKIKVGHIVSVTQTDTDAYKVIQVKAFASLSSLDRAVILRRTRPLPTLP